jgi:F420-non-reducing hydrogenase large subunit
MPDRLGLGSIFQQVADATFEKTRDAVARNALKVRKTGTDLITLAGGQFIHPIKAVIGGVTSGIGAAATDEMRARLERTLPIADQLFEYYVETSVALRERIGTWGDDAPAYYIAATSENRPRFYGDFIRILGFDGTICREFPAADYRDHLDLRETDYSYAGQTSFDGDVMRANSLARINITQRLGTTRADDYLRRFRDAFGQPAHAILLFDLCRGIELMYALERAIELLGEPLDDEDTDVPYTPRDGEGFGLVEAPRGPLIHHYRIANGLIAQAEFVIPTVHNMLAIERALRVAARRYITPEHVEMELEQAVGRVVRAFDPCIACATH